MSPFVSSASRGSYSRPHRLGNFNNKSCAYFVCFAALAGVASVRFVLNQQEVNKYTQRLTENFFVLNRIRKGRIISAGIY